MYYQYLYKKRDWYLRHKNNYLYNISIVNEGSELHTQNRELTLMIYKAKIIYSSGQLESFDVIVDNKSIEVERYQRIIIPDSSMIFYKWDMA